jgi:hypothetical protein
MMKHPFSLKVNCVQHAELNAEETEVVSGGSSINQLIATTLAVGEEGGGIGGPIRPGKPIYTTLALGEEGGIGGPILM